MRREIKPSDFNFDYTGSSYTEEDVLKHGIEKLTGKELRIAIVNKTIYGEYPMGYKFIADIYENGKTEGVNHVGSHDLGDWMIDMERHTLSLTWSNGWVDTTTHAYEINGHIEFFDVGTGKWRTTFRKWENWNKG